LSAHKVAGAQGSRSTSRFSFDPLRATALLFIAAGLILIISFFYVTSQAVADQQRLDQAWRTDVQVPTSAPAQVQPDMRHPVNGVDFAINIPKLNYFAAVKEGISTGVLYSGPGHYPQTPWPGQPGMVGVAAHNVYWLNFPTLAPGDEVDLQTRYGNYRYRVTGSRIVNPSDTTVMVPDALGYHLTLTTCWPLWAGAFATQRYVIFTDQVWPLTQKPGNV
jgi:sortase A